MAWLAGWGTLAGIVVSGPASAAVTVPPVGGALAPVVQNALQPGLPLSAPDVGLAVIVPQYQETDYWCVPASSSVSLATMGALATQSSLATQMKTTSAGTYANKAQPVLNKYAAPKGYKYGYANVSTGTRMLNAVKYDVGTLHKATVLYVWWERLPWNKGKTTQTGLGHAIVVNGYDSTTKTITVWDPWVATGGAHSVAASSLAAATQTNGLDYVTKK